MFCLSGLIREQKMMLAGLKVAEQDFGRSGYVNQYMTKIVRLCEDIALVFYDFKCAGCGRADALQFHHLIGRVNKNFLPVQVYFSQRHYWANVVILCPECHNQVHNRNPIDNMFKCISVDRINKLKLSIRRDLL